jgi:hypothetical protein
MKGQFRSNFNWYTECIGGMKVLLIHDEDLGGRSVTNDIENVVDYIASAEKIDPSE